MQVRFFTVIPTTDSSNVSDLRSAFGDNTPIFSTAVSTPTAYLFCLSTAPYTVDAIQSTCAKYDFSYIEEDVGVLDVLEVEYNPLHRTVRLVGAPFFALEAL